MNNVTAPVDAPTTPKEITDVSSMLLPLAERMLLLPGVAIAEIVTFSVPEAVQDEEAPGWFLGNILWRNLQVPLVSYEAYFGEPLPPIGRHCRLAILNNTGLSHQLGFFAILLQGTPRLLRLKPDDIAADDEKPLQEGDRAHVRVSGDEATIPDISRIERGIIDYLELT